MIPRKINFAAAIALFLLAGCRGFEQTEKTEGEKPRLPVTAVAKIDRASITIGDKIKYTVTVSTRRNVEVEFPDFAENLPGFAVKDFGSGKRKFFAKKTLIQWYLLDTYTSGEYVIPGAVIRYRTPDDEKWSRIETEELTLQVKSVLEKEASDIKDIKGPVNFPGRLLPLLVAGLILFVLFAAVIGILLIRARKLARPPPPPRPAHELAFERLEGLKRKDYPRLGKIKEYYFELSQIVRHYLEDRFSLRAPEMTTEEFLFTIKGSRRLSYEHKSILREFLSCCDLVKFARYGPSANEIETSFSSAVNLVEQTKAVEVESRE